MRHFASAAEIPAGLWIWPHVDPAREWACKGTGKIVIVEAFLDLFEKLRLMHGKPLVIASGYRSPEHNVTVSTTGDAGPHTTGQAVDIRIYGADALSLVGLALGLGFTGIGLQQKGPQVGRYVHLDSLAAPDYPRPNIWTY
jgi:hypothetical protein